MCFAKAGNGGSAGFSLMELLAVVFIISLALGLGIGLGFRDSSYQLRNAAKQFALDVESALEEAVYDGNLWGIDLFRLEGGAEAGYGYRWLKREAGIWGSPAAVAGEAVEHMQSLPGRIRLNLQVEGREVEIGIKQKITEDDADLVKPEILLFPSYEINHFVLSFHNEEDEAFRLESGGLGRLSLEQIQQ